MSAPTSTTAAEALLAALRGRCGHGSSYTCEVCEARITAEVRLEGKLTERILAYAIAATKALLAAEGLEHWTPEHSSQWWVEAAAPALALWAALRWGKEDGHD